MRLLPSKAFAPAMVQLSTWLDLDMPILRVRPVTFPNARDCEHGHLRRKCELCAKDRELKLFRSPSYKMLKALCGDPVILAASDEQEIRMRYAAMLDAVDEQLSTL